jgi:hypothetical protein
MAVIVTVAKVAWDYCWSKPMMGGERVKPIVVVSSVVEGFREYRQAS